VLLRKKMETNVFPQRVVSHITANGNEIINTPARFGVDKGCGNVLRRPDVFCEARAACSLAETKPCDRCHR
jgi:hypothetical protein